MARALPVVLTAADWDKKKGTIAKIAGETGVGAQLKKVENAWKVIDWSAFDASAVLKRAKTPKDVDDAIAGAKKEYAGTVEKLRAELVKARDLAKKTATDFEKKKVIPKASIDAVKAIASDADSYFIELKSMDAELKALEATKGKLNPGAVTEGKVSDIAGTDYFKELAKITIPANGLVKAFATRPEFTKSAGDGTEDAQLAKWQANFYKEVKVFANTLSKMQSVEGKVMKVADVKKIMPEATSTLYDAFHTMKPGMRGCLGEWVGRQQELARAGGKKLADNPAFKEAEKLGAYLQQQEVTVMKLDGFGDKMRFG